MRVLAFFWLLTTAGAGIQTATAQSYTHPSGVEVYLEPDSAMFPESWLGDRIDAQAVALDTAEFSRSKAIIDQCLSMYPKEVLSKYLNKVYVTQELHFFGVEYGGTYTHASVFVTNKGLAKGYTNAYISRVFHAELSSIFYNASELAFPKDEWEAAKHPMVEYGQGGMQAIKSGGASEAMSDSLHRIGFLNQYTTSSMENDFNGFAKNLWVPSEDFWNVTKAYPRLQKKLQLTIAFYQKLNPEYDLAFFKSLMPESEPVIDPKHKP